MWMKCPPSDSDPSGVPEAGRYILVTMTLGVATNRGDDKNLRWQASDLSSSARVPGWMGGRSSSPIRRGAGIAHDNVSGRIRPGSFPNKMIPCS